MILVNSFLRTGKTSQYLVMFRASSISEMLQSTYKGAFMAKILFPINFRPLSALKDAFVAIFNFLMLWFAVAESNLNTHRFYIGIIPWNCWFSLTIHLNVINPPRFAVMKLA